MRDVFILRIYTLDMEMRMLWACSIPQTILDSCIYVKEPTVAPSCWDGEAQFNALLKVCSMPQVATKTQVNSPVPLPGFYRKESCTLKTERVIHNFPIVSDWGNRTWCSSPFFCCLNISTVCSVLLPTYGTQLAPPSRLFHLRPSSHILSVYPSAFWGCFQF